MKKATLFLLKIIIKQMKNFQDRIRKPCSQPQCVVASLVDISSLCLHTGNTAQLSDSIKVLINISKYLTVSTQEAYKGGGASFYHTPLMSKGSEAQFSFLTYLTLKLPHNLSVSPLFPEKGLCTPLTVIDMIRWSNTSDMMKS